MKNIFEENHDFNRLRCPECTKLYKDNDQVYLDSWNTVRHQACFSPSIPFEVTDGGTYRYIITKYDFFEELRIFR